MLTEGVGTEAAVEVRRRGYPPGKTARVCVVEGGFIWWKRDEPLKRVSELTGVAHESSGYRSGARMRFSGDG